ncbi:MAG: hypothetical protein JXK04_01370 [Campylobacterales bacterium]|nr:hypothetical protein [Campylobacterales bacterium]
MRPIVYILLLAVAALVFKAFFLDAYLAERKSAESNAVETNVSIAEKAEESFSKPVPNLKSSGIYTGEQNVTIVKSKPSYSEMPLEKVGDTIAEKLESQIRVDENGK